MAYERVYQNRINWKNKPSTATPIDEVNLNQMDYALNQIDEVLSDWDNSKANTDDLNTLEFNTTRDITNLNNDLSRFKNATNAELERLDTVKPEYLKNQKDVSITNPADGEVLMYDGNKWKNGVTDIGLFVQNGMLMCRYSN